MIRAYLHRWAHCLRGMLAGHQGATSYDEQGRVTGIGCSCGRWFWIRPVKVRFGE